jgi:quercetin dioxygenase-like cupin family protein
MIRCRTVTLWIVPLVSIAMTAGAARDDAPGSPVESHPTYAYATNGVTENVMDRSGDKWRLLLDESVLGGKELEMTELTMPAGTTVRSHHHGSIEVIYVLSGVYGHEVNGKLYMLKPGMVGIVRPGDSVRHLVPKSGETKVLIIWAPAGEAARVVPKGPRPEPVREAPSLDP